MIRHRLDIKFSHKKRKKRKRFISTLLSIVMIICMVYSIITLVISYYRDKTQFIQEMERKENE